MWHAEAVDPWLVGLVVLVVAGLGAIVFGALHDRSRNRRRAAEMLAPPARPIPRLSAEAPAPRYLSDLQARRAPAARIPLARAERDRVAAQLSSAPTVRVGYASKDFITDPDAGWALLEAPRILVCDDDVASIRELLPTLEKLIVSKTPLVVVAPDIEPSVRATLEVNAIRRTMPLLAVLATDPEDRRRVAEASGATVTDRADRQSGYLPPDHLGRLQRWVSTRSDSYLIAPAGTPADHPQQPEEQRG